MAVAERPVTDGVHDRWKQLYADYYQMALSLARDRVRNEADAEDAAQKTFIGVYEILAAGKPVDNWAAMITTIVERAAGKERFAGERSQALRPTHPVDQVGAQDAAERRDAFRASFRSLSEAEQQAVYHTLVEGLTAAEVGERLGTSAESARHLLSRGRARLVLDMVTTNLPGEAAADDRPVSDICRYLANRMSSDERKQFAEHLKTCARCRMTVERVREFRGFVLILLPAGLVGLYGDHLYAQIQAQEAAAKTVPLRSLDRRVVAAGLIAALLIGGGAVVILTHKPTPAAPVLAASGCPTGKVGGFAYLDNGNVMYRSSPSAGPQQMSSSGRADELMWTPDGGTLIYKDARVSRLVAGTLYAVHPGSAPFWSFGSAIDSFAVSPDGKLVASLIEHDAPDGNWAGWTLDIRAIGSPPGAAGVDREIAAPVPDQWQDSPNGEPFAEGVYSVSGFYSGVFWFSHAIYVADGEQVAVFDEAGSQTSGWAAPSPTFKSSVAGLAEPQKSVIHFDAQTGAVNATCGATTKPVAAPPALSGAGSNTFMLVDDPKNPRAGLAVRASLGPGSGDIYLVTADGSATAITTDHRSYLPVWQP